MTKPWEFENIEIEKGTGRDCEGDLWLYAGEDAQIGVVTQEAPGGADAWAKMFRASPKMVRALFLSGARGPFGWHTLDCLSLPVDFACTPTCVAPRAALEAAGVPLP